MDWIFHIFLLVLCFTPEMIAVYNICDRTTLVASTEKKYVTSPYYPSNYRGSTTCSVTVQLDPNLACYNDIELKIVSFRTESCCDYLKVYDGNSSSSNPKSTLKGSLSTTTMVTTGRSMHLYFRTDGSVHMSGFNVSIRAVEGGDHVSPGSAGVASGNNDVCAVSSVGVASTPGHIISPRFPNPYPRNINCQMTMCSSASSIIRLKMINMDLGEDGDTVIVSKGSLTDREVVAKFQGNEIPEPVFLLGNRYNISFYSGNHGEDTPRGFNMSFLQYQAPMLFTDLCGTEQVNLIATEEEHVIVSQGFPYSYPNSLRCSWFISTDDELHSILKISVHNISLEDTFDYLRVYDGDSTRDKEIASYTGVYEDNKIISPIYTSGPDVFIVFSTDRKNTDDGFRISYTKQLTIPKFSDNVNITSETNRAQITVHFSTMFHFTDLKWLKNGAVIRTGGDSQYKIDLNERKEEEFETYDSTLTITGLASQDFGEYKISVQNPHGIADMVVMLHKPQAVPDVLTSSTDVQLYNATLNVNFTSNPLYERVEWFKINGDSIQHINQTGFKYIKAIAEERQDNGNIIYTASLTIRNLVEEDLTVYKIGIQNSAGVASSDLRLSFPATAMPVIDENIDASIGRRNGKIVVSFESMLGVNYVEFRKNGILLENNLKYSIAIVQRASRRRRSQAEVFVSPTAISNLTFINITNSVHVVNETSFMLNDTDLSINQSVVLPARRGLPVHRETHTLIIKSLTEDDFGTYKVTVRNAAGIAERYVELLRAPVFPLERTCPQTSDIDMTCRVESCTAHNLFWIHSVGGVTVRTLDGSQTANENTLTIKGCEFADSGAYSCAIAKNNVDNVIDNVNGSSTRGTEHEILMGGTATLQVNGCPIVAGSKTSINQLRAAITVEFSSYPRYTSVRWYKNGREINTKNSTVYSADTDTATVVQTYYGQSVNAKGYNSTLYIRKPLPENSYGVYKVKVENKIGHTSSFITLRDPLEGPPILKSGVTRTEVEGRKVFSVIFRSFPSPISSIWSKDGNDVTGQSGFTVQMEAVNTSDNLYVSRLSIQNMQPEHFRQYNLYINNDVGYIETKFELKNPNEGVAVFYDDVVITLTNVTAMAEVTFSSEPPFTSLKWYKGSMPLSSGDQYAMNVDRSAKEGDLIATLVVTNLQEDDLGIYKIVVKNDFGVTEKHFNMDRECPAT